MDTVTLTAKYQLDASHILSSVSPALAALHATRAQNSYCSSQPYVHPLSPLHCPRCAHLPVTTRVVANSKQRRTRGSKTENAENTIRPPSRGLRVQRSCAACGYVGVQAVKRNDINAIETTPSCPSRQAASPAVIGSTAVAGTRDDNTLTESSKGKARAETPLPVDRPVHVSSDARPSPSSPVHSQPGSVTKRQKKRAAGLQEILSRSKKQTQNSQRDGVQSANDLAAFLSGL